MNDSVRKGIKVLTTLADVDVRVSGVLVDCRKFGAGEVEISQGAYVFVELGNA